PADDLDLRGGALRRLRRDRRRAHLRRVLPLLPAAPPAGLAARGARLDPLAPPTRDRVRVAELRPAAGDRVHPRARAASAARPFPWRGGTGPSPEPTQPTSLPAGQLGVRFEDVHFSYGSGSEVLSGVQLDTQPGEVIAVCGPTGAGKTSLLNLLPRFYDPTDGRVLIGGVDARDLTLEELRASVAVVTQRPILFSLPLRENLTAARPDAPWEEVVAACEAAGVAHFAT